MNSIVISAAKFIFENAYFAYKPLYSLYKTYSDREERTQIQQLVTRGMTIIDVGANIGIYTRYFSKLVGETGKVIAFEPDDSNFDHLKKSTQGLPNATAVKAIVGNVHGKSKFFISSLLNVDHRAYDDGNSRSCREVDSIRLDEYLSADCKVNFIKIDVQGYELQVLQGAQRIIDTIPELVLLIEFWPHGLKQAGTSPDDLLGFIQKSGFTLYDNSMKEISPDYLLANYDSESGKYCNLFLKRNP